MFKRKKFMTLCITTLAGISALGSFAPMAAFADVSKNGDTVITYEGASKPAEWGLSVPAAVKLDKDRDPVDQSMYGNAKISIVDSDTAAPFKGNKNKEFMVSGKAKYYSSGALELRNTKDQTVSTTMYVTWTPQTVNGDEPTGWATPTDSGSGNSVKSLENQVIKAPADGSVEASRWIQFLGDNLKKVTPAGDSMTNTISWTATEKTS